MNKVLPIFKGTTGLNNKVDPSRVEDSDIVTALNVNIDDSGRVSRRLSFVNTGCTLSVNSLYSNGERGLFKVDDDLYLLYPDLTYSLIAAGLNTQYPMRCCTVNSIIYFVNETVVGKVENDVAGPWEGADYVGPTTFRKFSDPPKGHLIAFLGGRIYVAGNNTVWYSEPFAYSWFDLARNYFMFNSRIKMLAAVDDGLYISTESVVYFLNGTVPSEMAQLKVHSYPAIEGTDVYTPGGQVLETEDTRQALLFTSTRSVCACFNSGRIVEMTEKKVSYPEGSYGSAAFLNNTYYALINE